MVPRWSLRSYRAALVIVPALFAAPVQAQTLTPLGVTGFNQDVVYENANPTAVTAYFDTAAGGRNNWIADGVGGGGFGLGTVVSAATNTVTGEHSIFDFASFSANNALLLTETNQTGTLTLANPTALTSIAIAAASGNATPISTSTLTLNFAGGVTESNISYNAFDWVTGNGSASDIFATNLNRTAGDPGGTMSYPTANAVPLDLVNHPNLFETDLDLTNINGKDYSNVALESITFNITKTSTPFKTTTGILALSGTNCRSSVPEPGTLALLGTFLLPLLGVVRRGRS